MIETNDVGVMANETGIIEKTDPQIMKEKWWANREGAEQERIRKWREKQAKELPDFKHEAKETKENYYDVQIKFNDDELSEQQKLDIVSAHRGKTSGFLCKL